MAIDPSRVSFTLFSAPPGEGAIVHAPGDIGDVRLRGRRRLVDAHTVGVPLEDGAGGQEVEVHVQIGNIAVLAVE